MLRTEKCPEEHPPVPVHLQQLYNIACKNCSGRYQEEKLAMLLNKFESVFSKDDQDVGHTKLVEHSLPVLSNTRPIRQPPHRLGPQKEQEVEKQVQQLLEQGFI